MTTANHSTKEEVDYLPHDQKEVIKSVGKKALLHHLEQMLLIRNFEIRSESAYQQGKVGGFFHSYMGQEAIQTAAVSVLGPNNWYITSYRCHALALLLGEPPFELMAELYGREAGNAKGRGGSMHFFSERLLGGFGIVGGQIPIATGAAFSIKYRMQEREVAICFFGDGAVAQGAFHESLNMASLWELPCIYVIENNSWGMGTGVERAIAAKKLAEQIAPAYGINGYTLDGMNFFNCYSGFKTIAAEVLKTGRPVLVEAITNRFRGHSISDPGLYRSKEELTECQKRDPIAFMREVLIREKIIDEASYKELDQKQKKKVVEAMKQADASPWPDVHSLEEGVYSP